MAAAGRLQEELASPTPGVLEEGFLQAHWIQNLVATNQAMVVIKQFRNFCNITWI